MLLLFTRGCDQVNGGEQLRTKAYFFIFVLGSRGDIVHIRTHWIYGLSTHVLCYIFAYNNSRLVYFCYNNIFAAMETCKFCPILNSNVVKYDVIVDALQQITSFVYVQFKTG